MSIKKLAKYSTESIQSFLKTGKSDCLNDELQKFILQMDFAAKQLDKTGNISTIAYNLQKQWSNLTFSTARSRVYDAINYFQVNSPVPSEKWDAYYADRFENMGLMAMKHDDMNTAYKCFEKAHSLRIKNSENVIPEHLLKMREIIISSEISPEKLGIGEHDIDEIWLEGKKFINKLEIDKEIKALLKKDLALNLSVNFNESEITDIEPIP